MRPKTTAKQAEKSDHLKPNWDLGLLKITGQVG